MTPGSRAHQVVTSSEDLSRKWNGAIEWLQHELDRRAPIAGSYGYVRIHTFFLFSIIRLWIELNNVNIMLLLN
jgi:hypothetical protein